MTRSKSNNHAPQTQLLERCAELSEHVRQLRDYGTTPGNTWLARSHLQQIQVLAAEVERLLEEIKRQEQAQD
jgi:hypothetical protein